MAEKEKRKVDGKNLLVRTISGAAVFVIMAGLIFLGGWFFFGGTLALSLMGLYEFYHVFGIERAPEGIAGYLLTAGFYVILGFGRDDLLIPFFAGAFLLEAALYVFRFEKTDSERAMASFFGIVYVPFLFSYLIRIRELPQGIWLIWLSMAGSWVCDMFAYFVGSFFGRHKMAPVLSPKKSVEGAVGGVLGSAAVGALFSLFLPDKTIFRSDPALVLAIVSAAAALISMVGDLLASAFKRNHGIKDYSNLIPGHGGILDRFDSMIFVAPVIYYVLVLFLAV